MSDQLDRIEAKVDELLDWKNGTRDSLGVNVRLDRLEQASESKQWWMRTAIGAAMASLFGSVYLLFKRGGM